MRKGIWRTAVIAAALFTAGEASPAQAQETAPAAAGTAQLTFLPPPMENATFSLGLYEAKSGRLVRRLHEFAPESAFVAGLNGLITRWDRKDDAGRLAPAGRYAARGYAVGPLRIEGVAFHGNDWVDADEKLRVKHVDSIGLDGGLLRVEATMAGGGAETLMLSPEGDVVSESANPSSAGAPASGPVPGKDGSTWSAEGELGVIQRSGGGEVLRRLAPVAGDPLPRAVAASTADDRLWLLEEKEGWQRLRALSWVDAREEGGKSVSTWQTVFERNIRADAAAPEVAAHPVEIALVENPLSPGKPGKAELAAGFDAEGSYLQTAAGLRLRRVSARRFLSDARLVARGKALTFYQFDGAAWDEFSIAGAGDMMAFDAGTLELTATGEKPPDPKPTEPPDL